MGDAFVVDFPSVVHAVQCAQQIQSQLRTYNAEKDKDEQIHVRIGIHLGDIVQRDGDVFGDGVNIASRLQTLAEPDTICISEAVYKEVARNSPLGTVVSLGRPKLKNIAERFPVYALLPEPPTGTTPTPPSPTPETLPSVRPAHRVVVAACCSSRSNPRRPLSPSFLLSPQSSSVLSRPSPAPARQALHRRAALRQHE